MSLAEFVSAYIETALWSSSDGENGEVNLDGPGLGESALTDEAREALTSEATKFYEAHSLTWFGKGRAKPAGYSEDEAAGHDFWLTRNRHGAGFWDGDWNEPEASTLTKLAHECGEVSLLLGDDGRISYFDG